MTEAGRLREELRQLDDEFHRRYAAGATGFSFSTGRRPTRHLSAQALARLYFGFCLSAFAAGAVLATLDATKELGVAMVVGALFAGGSFIAQAWMLQVERERAVKGALWGDAERAEMRAMLDRRRQLVAELDQLDRRRSA